MRIFLAPRCWQSPCAKWHWRWQDITAGSVSMCSVWQFTPCTVASALAVHHQRLGIDVQRVAVHPCTVASALAVHQYRRSINVQPVGAVHTLRQVLRAGQATLPHVCTTLSSQVPLTRTLPACPCRHPLLCNRAHTPHVTAPPSRAPTGKT
jgi:hypothetical protein